MNSQRESELKPCPFCGSTDVGGAGGVVHCYRCNAQIAVQNANTHYAGQLWNTRQAATEQGVGEAVAWYDPEQKWNLLNGGVISVCGQKTPMFSAPLYTHPPKPTYGDS